jgi:hypothetical protein
MFSPSGGRGRKFESCHPDLNVKYIMKINQEKIDEMVLALMYLGMHDNGRAWKSFDWESLNRLHEKNLIFNPVNKVCCLL